jgi:hypothetical protein
MAAFMLMVLGSTRSIGISTYWLGMDGFSLLLMMMAKSRLLLLALRLRGLRASMALNFGRSFKRR